MNSDDRRETIVIYRLGSLGDTIVALPCFHAIARRFPNARRLLLTNVPVSAKAAPILSILGFEGQFVDEAVEYPVGLRSPRALWSLSRKLRRLGATRLVYLMPERSRMAAWRDWLFFRFCGFDRILAFPASDDLRRVRVGPDGVLEPEAERLVRCSSRDFGAIDLTAAESWDLRLTDAEKAKGRGSVAGLAGAPYLAVNMGGKVAEKDWGIGNWTALMRRLAERYPGFGLAVLGAAVDAPQAEQLLAAWPGRKVNLCGALSPRESAAAMAEAICFIGHDSGPLHLAAASQVPCVGLFGDFNRPRQWHPIGPSVSVIHEMEGMGAIAVEDVERAVAARVEAAGVPALAGGL